MSGTASLPPGWALAPIGDLGKWTGGGTPAKSNPSYWSDGSIPWVSPKDMKVPVIVDSVDHITESGLRDSAATLIEPGSVLFVTRSGILAHTFPVARTAVSVTVNQDIKALTPPPSLNPDYIAWGVRAFGWTILNQCSKDGTTVASVDTALLHDFQLPIAPELEQPRIVEAIESYFTRLDDTVATLERVQRNLKRYRASVLKAAVEGRLVPTEAKLARAEGRDYEPASVLLERVLAERRRRWEEAELAKITTRGGAPTDGNWKSRYEEPSYPSYSDLPGLPEGWCWATMDQLAIVIGGGNAATATNEETSRCVLRSSAVRQGALDLGDYRFLSEDAPTTSDRFLQAGDLLFTRLSGTLAFVGNCAVVPELGGALFEFPDRIFRARLGEHVNGHYVAACFGAQHLRRPLESAAKSSAGHQRISLSDIRQFCVPLPPACEQARIADAVEEQLVAAGVVEASAVLDISRLRRLRQSLLKWAFEGRLVDQDPTDEPASALVEQIRAERHSSNGTPLKRPERRNARADKA